MSFEQQNGFYLENFEGFYLVNVLSMAAAIGNSALVQWALNIGKCQAITKSMHEVIKCQCCPAHWAHSATQ